MSAAVPVASVRERLARVTDPELDRSIVDLEYVDEVRVADGTVTVALTLPTAWCSPAFAWMMAVDAREEVAALDGVADVRVRLREHMHAEQINAGVDDHRSFSEAFPDAEDGVADVRATLDEKARLARQHAAVEELLDRGLTPAQVAALRPADVDLDGRGDRAAVTVREGALAVCVAAAPLERYLRKARETLDIGSRDPLVRTPDGDPVTPEAFERVHRRARLARVNMSGQGGVCAALNDARRAKLGRD
ncbi:MAG: iron-sulfur cluster assembly protein [Halobacteriaceae archaeon]